MPVMIKEINVKNLGPIPEKIQWKLGKLNLIYGKNETGKTYLVEFIIRSLFKAKGWKLRPPTGNGKIIVERLENRPVAFSPNSSRKFEDFYSKSKGSIPPDFSKLLVVKGAEVELGEGDADKIILKRYLSSKEILDIIEERIPKTIQKASIYRNKISGENRGDIKRRKELEEELKQMNNLFSEINSKYLGGDRKILEDRKKEIEEEIQEMEKARRYYAYKLSKEIEELEEKRNEIDDEILESISQKVEMYRQKHHEYKSNQERYQDLQDESAPYIWLKNATETYEGLINEVSLGGINNLLLLSLIALIVLAGIFSFLNLPFAVIGSLIGLILLGWLYIKGIKKSAEKIGEINEIKKIEEEYKRRIGQPLTGGLSQLKETMERMRKLHEQSEFLEQELIKVKTWLEQEKSQISDKIYELIGEKINPEEWREILQKIRKEKKKIDKKIREKREELIRLNVREDEYLTEEPPFSYDQKYYDELGEKLEEIKEKLEEIEGELDRLKARICYYTNDDITISWEDLIQNLREKYKETLNEYKEKTAEIVGQIAVMNVIRELREAEDEKIKQNLQSDVIKKPLFEVTNRYIDFRLEGDTLYVLDPYNEFPLNELSTGAKEQVLLALRMGFCSRILGQDCLFLILDDAFQYSDWNRRQLLVDKAVELAQNGWQIIYFTMDDNIKELFDMKGQVLGNDYKKFELPE